MKKIVYPLIKPFVPQGAVSKIRNIIKSGWLTYGPYGRKAEDLIKKYISAPYAYLVNSATSGLILALKALGIKEKSKIAVVSFSFPATANIVLLCRCQPVFVDIDLDTFNMSPSLLEETLKKDKKIKAVIFVSEFGNPYPVKKIAQITAKFGIALIEDAACSFGASYQGKFSGTFGRAGVFSFHPRKIITCGEGGCIIVKNKTQAKTIEMWRNHGEYKHSFLGFGYNFRLSDIQAALLLEELKIVSKTIEKRRRLAFNYHRLLKPLEEEGLLKRPLEKPSSFSTYQSYVLLLNRRINRNRLKDFLYQEKIETQFGTYCIPYLPFYRRNFDVEKFCYKNALFAYRHTLTLPLYHNLSFKEQKEIFERLKKYIYQCVQ